MPTQSAQTQTMDAKARQRQRLERRKLQMDYLKKAKEAQPEYTQCEYAKQAAAVLFQFAMWSVIPVITAIGPIWLLFTRYWYLNFIYGVWFAYDWRTPKTGGRHIKWWRESGLWKNVALYYPVGLVKTADLPPDRNYILGSHPHGFWCTGVFTNLLTDATNFEDKYPGLARYLLTLNGQFWFPVRRDVGINLGGVMASAESLEYILSTKSEGRIVGIVIGGSAEVLEAHMGKHVTFLSKRRGFCKYALKYGASLVPSYSFGENDVFRQIPNRKGTLLRKVQDTIKRYIGFCPPLYYGRGLFNGFFGLLPHRRPIVTVIGKPISVRKSDGEPTKEEIDVLHAEYTRQLLALFEEHKKNYGVAPDTHLQIL